MLVRDPTQLFARHGRQLLVEGVDFDGQQALFALGASFAASPPLHTAAEACARYLVGAGLGRVVVPSDGAAGLAALDPELRLLPSPAALEPPALHLHFVERPWGAAVDLVWLSAAGDDGAPTPAAVASLHWHTGEPWQAVDGVALGAAVAGVVLDKWLGLAPWPATVTIDLGAVAAAQVTVEPPPACTRHITAAVPTAVPDWLEDTEVAAAICHACEASYPVEACGLVLRDGAGRLRVRPVRNLQDHLNAHDPQQHPRTARTAFALDVRAVAAAEAEGEQVLAIWHSHCDAAAYLSAADREGMATAGLLHHPGVAYAVVAVHAGAATALRWFDAAGTELRPPDRSQRVARTPFR